ncbi:hypothetical protein QM797_22340 [Rhodococcus sp. IEGM 1381]|uniref:Rv0361 family membrane protein n=1 Tax=Rhodococcus sp. IEGM 1381 TaxID=3047085 RepID=UPI0024B81FED|nr:hypothetical protein [Rhodococcus sp. IEGM 1381]MDI9897468.1 hypothetical protein [Rhodococcus sp. IEGM 1381]
MASWSERRQQWVDSREEARNNASQAAADSGEQRPPNAWPFIIAAGIVVVVLVGIFAASKFAPAENNVTQAQLLTDAVDGFLEAQNSGDADLLRENTCFDQVALLITGDDAQYRTDRASEVDSNGETSIDGVPSEYEVNGDRGVVKVPLKEEKSGVQTDDQWKFVRVDDKWLVCNV